MGVSDRAPGATPQALPTAFEKSPQRSKSSRSRNATTIGCPRKRTNERSRLGVSGQKEITQMKRAASLLALALTFGALPARSQYVAKISWTASASAAANPSLTYNVYRASSCPGHFTQINAAPVAATSYVDSALA